MQFYFDVIVSFFCKPCMKYFYRRTQAVANVQCPWCKGNHIEVVSD